ncbi:MAG: HAMP domain-containing histidine kinase [Bacteroidales bacterium]|nr:HAMP domain-containing histidine kinase [Bacteroidales bacterium]
MKFLINKHLLPWQNELTKHLNVSKALGIAVIDQNYKCLYSNALMHSYLQNKPNDFFINPKLKDLFKTEKENQPIFEGMLTLGSEKAFDVSFNSKIFKANQNILVIAEIDAQELTSQNENINQLTIEVLNLQRQLIKEKKKLLQTVGLLEKKSVDIKKVNEELAELSKEKNLILGIAAHDIRGPLASIYSLANVITDPSLEKSADDIQRFSLHIKNYSDALLKLLSDLLDVSKIESGNIDLKSETNNYLKLVTEAIEIQYFLAKQKEIEIRLDYHTKRTDLSFDKHKMAQVINNLLSNAIKYSPPQTKVIVQISETRNSILTKVIDQGLSISKKDIEQIFIPFQKGSNIATAGEKSTGLGLAIVKKILIYHQSEIKISSKPGKGSTFSFELPF